MTDPATAQDCRWTLDGLDYAGLIWGPPDGVPVLALHGWLDHADSFRMLAPRLTGCRVVALDLSGQGHSAHRSPDATYNIWDDLPQIAALLDTLGWADCVLLGHSRGAIIGTLFAAAQPERVRALVALDALVPEPVPPEAITDTLRAFVEGTRRQAARPPRHYPTRDAYIARRSGPRNSPRTSEALADRALRETPDGYELRADPRLLASSTIKLSLPQIEAVLRGLRMPVLNIWARDGIRTDAARSDAALRRAGELVARYEMLELSGDHHFHLDPGIADQIAQAILAFLGGLTPGH